MADRQQIWILISTDKAAIRRVIGAFSTEARARDFGRNMLSATYTLTLETYWLDPEASD